MIGEARAEVRREAGYRRILGRYETGRPGPLVIVLGGSHGNEPAGVEASRRVLAALEQRRLPLSGRLLALAGNLPALAAGRRYLGRDLNRMWTEDELGRLGAEGLDLAAPEHREQRELFAIIEGAIAAEPGDFVLVDLHSTSAQGPPFSIISDTLQSREIALALPVPLLLGIEEEIQGSLLAYMEQRGRVALVVEGGQHQDPETPELLEAAVWLALVAAGSLEAREVPDLAGYRRRLSRATRRQPPVVEVTYRHGITPEDGFAMAPGFRNFQRVAAGQVLARDRRGEVAAPADGFLIMPLYQSLGDDGYFLGQRVLRFWLHLSTLLRRLKADRLLPHLPGVTRDPGQPERLRVDPGIARWLARQIFHLCGYRRLPPEGDRLVFVRRQEPR